MKRISGIFLSITLLLLVISACASDETVPRKWISHRGVDLNHTIAGENSLEAVAYARMVGFECIETDVRTTSDGILVCMHDETINRTCLNKDGSEIQEKTRVCDLTFDELRSGYKLKADREDMRTQVPTLEEYLTCCKENGLLVFIEPKLKDQTGENYLRIMEIADRIFGRDGYIITSNNFANDIIRNTLGISDVKVMTILYQTTYEAVQALGNSVMAISSSRFNKEDFAKNMEKAVADGFETESNTDNFPRMDMINKAHVDYISTDLLLPDYKGLGKLAYDLRSTSKWNKLGEHGQVGFGALFLEMTYAGEAEITLGKQTFTINDSNGIDAGNGFRTISFQILLYQEDPVAEIKAMTSGFNVTDSRLRLVTFPQLL